MTEQTLREKLLARRDVLAKLQNRREQLEASSREFLISLPIEEIMRMGNDILDWRQAAQENANASPVGSMRHLGESVAAIIYTFAYVEYVNSLLRIVETE